MQISQTLKREIPYKIVSYFFVTRSSFHFDVPPLGKIWRVSWYYLQPMRKGTCVFSMGAAMVALVLQCPVHLHMWCPGIETRYNTIRKTRILLYFAISYLISVACHDVKAPYIKLVFKVVNELSLRLRLIIIQVKSEKKKKNMI